MESNNHSIYISYRHEDASFAVLVHDILVKRGYSIFLDRQPTNGPFPDNNRIAIEHCVDFLLLVTINTFPTGVLTDDDWVRNEIQIALGNNKNIIPIFYNAEFPSNLPAEIKEVSSNPSVRVLDLQNIDNEIFDMHINLLQSEIRRRRTPPAIYTPESAEERLRLAIQAENAKNSDADAIGIALKNFREEQELNVLDLGCGYGFVGHSRFNSNRFRNVIGVDKSEECIEYAKENFSSNRFSYYSADLTLDFDKTLENIKKDKNIESFDIVFIALVLHILGDTAVQKLLLDIRKCISNRGVIIVRSSDDGSKLPYNDDGNLQKIIQLTTSVVGISDRFNGRKIFGYLSNSGYRDIQIKSYMKDTSLLSIEEQMRLFEESFSYRLRYFKRMHEDEPDNREYQSNLFEMEELIGNFKARFTTPNFWYCEYDYVGIANV